jgi:hypothetical protein
MAAYCLHSTSTKQMNPVTNTAAMIDMRSDHSFFSCGVGRDRIHSQLKIARKAQPAKYSGK